MRSDDGGCCWAHQSVAADANTIGARACRELARELRAGLRADMPRSSFLGSVETLITSAIFDPTPGNDAPITHLNCEEILKPEPVVKSTDQIVVVGR